MATTAVDGTFRQLIDEWERLDRRRSPVETVNSWGLLSHRVGNLDEILVAAGFGLATDDADGDHILWHLVALARHDQLAARIVLHRITPALIAAAKRRGRITKGGMNRAVDDIIPAAWLTIRAFPHERRLTKIAANLVLDSEYQAFVREARLRRVDEVPVMPELLGRHRPAEQSPVVDIELRAVLDDAWSRGAPGHHVELLRRYGAGMNSDAIGASTGKSARTVRNHRLAAINAVRSALSDDSA